MKRRSRMVLPHGETDPKKTYSFPDPDVLHGAHSRLYHAVWYDGTPLGEKRPETVRVSREDLTDLLSLAGAYLDLTMYELGQEHCVGKLRDIWRARRALPTPAQTECCACDGHVECAHTCSRKEPR